MFVHHDRSDDLARIAAQLQSEDDLSPDALWRISAALCDRGMSCDAKLAQLQQCIKDGACTDAALLLIELELPFWKLRRLVYDMGEWHCALSRQRELPDWLDEAIETRHPQLAVAILKGIVEALETQRVMPSGLKPIVAPRALPASEATLCCDNFC